MQKKGAIISHLKAKVKLLKQKIAELESQLAESPTPQRQQCQSNWGEWRPAKTADINGWYTKIPWSPNRNQ